MYKLGKTRETGNDDGYPKTSPSVDLSHFRPFTSFRIKRLFAGTHHWPSGDDLRLASSITRFSGVCYALGRVNQKLLIFLKGFFFFAFTELDTFSICLTYE